MKRIIFSAMLVMSACMVFAARNYIYEMPVTEGCQAVRERLEDNRFEFIKVKGNQLYYRDNISTYAVLREEGEIVDVLFFMTYIEPNSRKAQKQLDEIVKETEKRFGKVNNVREDADAISYFWYRDNGYTFIVESDKESITMTWALSSNQE